MTVLESKSGNAFDFDRRNGRDRDVLNRIADEPTLVLPTSSSSVQEPFEEHAASRPTREYVQTIHGILQSLQNHAAATDCKLREWISQANRTDDFWVRVNLAQLLAKIHAGEEIWGRLVIAWLRKAALKKSNWTEDLVYWALKGWPQLFIKSEIGYALALLHPQALSIGLLRYLEQRGV